ncbi:MULTISPECIES: enoyl-CoA hydratase/isomerase family protein [Xanthobacter]|uniref:enoyl-CoA hydratase/isomerase family protein n=1 Tax=Xanthobacter TaxID=279 RepID=UPI002022D0BA|nr:enoyl-CoA hydratase/isomerase family protein [Xanthobacter aminoxidans]MCL8383531.1 enoyl-CoA hydratase/isomerase family protein [Xanthobacter aminoxidans]
MIEADEDRVLCTREGPLAILTLNEPKRMNVYSPQLRDQLLGRLRDLNDDDTCRAIVLTGAGGHFSAGGDIASFNERDALAMRSRMERTSMQLVRLLIAGRKPVITAVEGNCYGAGLSLMSASDYAVAARDAKLCCAFIRMGFIPDLGTLWSLPRRVGLGKAKELTALASVLDGAEAGRIGLVDEVVEPGAALAAAKAVALRFAKASPPAMAMLKEAFSEGLEAALRQEIAFQPMLAMSEEHAEAKRRFLEARDRKTSAE